MRVVVGRYLFMAVLICLLVPMQLTADADPSLDPSSINPFDSLLLFPYSEPLSVASDVTQYISLLTPAIFSLATPSSDWLEISVLYATSAIFSFGTRTALKYAVERNRPYMYNQDSLPSDAEKLLEDGLDSFPSGHTIMAFTGAAFTQAVFSLRYPDSPYRRAATITAWTLAGATAALRVASGNHFVTDVLAGAAIGSFYGFVVPYLAWKFLPSWKGERFSVALGPTAAVIHMDF